MNPLFADTLYWVARINPKDQWHSLYRDFDGRDVLTTDEVLYEVLAHFSEFGPKMRRRVVTVIREILADSYIEVVPQSRLTFLDALHLFETRPDKAYSLTDCSSMATMLARGITEVLTRDAHFKQEGFTLIP